MFHFLFLGNKLFIAYKDYFTEIPNCQPLITFEHTSALHYYEYRNDNLTIEHNLYFGE